MKLVIFDMDGVLADLRDVHYDALNDALAEFGLERISRADHLAKYDGLPTRVKLECLGVPTALRSRVAEMKQQLTRQRVRAVAYDSGKAELVSRLRSEGLKVAVASNSVRKTVELVVRDRLRLEVDCLLSNEDVDEPKPSPAIYLKAMQECGASPSETLVIEDSSVGRRAAEASGARVLGVSSPEQVTYPRVKAALQQSKPSVWDAGDATVLIPMAGAGSRFAQAGFTFPKPLVEVGGKPMIQVVVENLAIRATYVFIVQAAHDDKYNLSMMLPLISPGCKVVRTEGPKHGAAWDTLLASDFIDNDRPLVVANSDQIVKWNSGDFMWSMSGADAGIATFHSKHPKWSFCRIEDGRVVEVAEKKPISNVATCGIYYWRRGADYVRLTRRMMEDDAKRVNGEWYVAPVFNEAVADGMFVKPFPVERMWGLGTPEDLREYVRQCC